MKLIVSAAVREKLATRHQVTSAEVIHLKSAFEPNDEEMRIYSRHGFSS
jgi:hypothetical protein